MTVRHTARVISPIRQQKRPAQSSYLKRRVVLVLGIVFSVPVLGLAGWGLRPVPAPPVTAYPVSRPAARPDESAPQQRGRWLTPQVQPSPSPARARPALAHSTSRPPEFGSAHLQAELEAWTRERPGTYGIVVLDLSSGARYAVNAEAKFPPASLYKLLVLAEAYRQIEQGALTLEDSIVITPADASIGEPPGGVAVGEEVTVARALEAIARVSSNAAADALIRRLGPEAVAGVVARLGLAGTRFPTRDDDAAEITAADVASYFERLAQGELESRWVSQQILDQLAQSKVNDRLPAELPPGTIVAHKTGDQERVVHDAGIIYGARGPMVLVLLSQGAGNGQAAVDFGQLARQILDVLNRSSDR